MDKSESFNQNKIDDLIRLASRRGVSTHSAFLTSEEASKAKSYLLSRRLDESEYLFFGGAAGAERCCLVIGEYPESSDAQIACLFVCVCLFGSEKSDLTHRDVLGAILSLGIERDAVGDIVAREGGSFFVFVRESVADFICENLSRIGRYKVAIGRTEIGDDFVIEHPEEEQTIVISSLRADCVTAAICRLSREKAKELIRRGELMCDHAVCGEPDLLLREGQVLSIRHIGRYRIGEILPSVTRSGRIRLKIYRAV